MSEANFLENMFKSSTTAYIAVWESKSKTTKFFSNQEILSLFEYVESSYTDKDVYFGVGLLEKPLGSGRGTLEDIVGIGCMWIDIDHAGGVHSAINLPTEERAFEVIGEFPLEPSIIVSSGGGLHVYWLLEEVWMFNSEEDKKDAAALVEDLQRSMQAAADFKIDTTKDLTRVLRVPGTLNHKTEPPKEVQIRQADYERRYSRQDIREAVEAYREAAEVKPLETPLIEITPVETDYPPTQYDPIFERCAFIQHCENDAETLTEPEWYDALSILARCEDGEAICHEISARDSKRYKASETQKKINHALQAPGPKKCENIKEHGYCNDCTEIGKSPAVLGIPKKENPPPKLPKKSLKTIQLSTVEPEEIPWLWYPYIPLGRITIMQGEPGVGKSWAILDIAARVSRGEYNDENRPGTVIYATAEDNYADTIVPRLEAQGANLDYIHGIEGIQNAKGEIIENLSCDTLEELDAKMEELKPCLVVLDPLQAYLGKNIDMHRADQTSIFTGKLKRLAEKYNCAFVIIRHLRKSKEGSSKNSGLGSINFTAAVRSELIVAEYPGSPNIRAMAQNKENLAPKGKSVCFTIDDGKLKWLDESNITVDELLNGEMYEEREIDVWLRDLLADGPVPANDIASSGKVAGYSVKQLNSAKKRLKIKSARDGKLGIWRWELPKAQEARFPNKATAQKLGDLGDLGDLEDNIIYTDKLWTLLSDILGIIPGKITSDRYWEMNDSYLERSLAIDRYHSNKELFEDIQHLFTQDDFMNKTSSQIAWEFVNMPEDVSCN